MTQRSLTAENQFIHLVMEPMTLMKFHPVISTCSISDIQRTTFQPFLREIRIIYSKFLTAV